jgi:hypothetical protein
MYYNTRKIAPVQIMDLGEWRPKSRSTGCWGGANWRIKPLVTTADDWLPAEIRRTTVLSVKDCVRCEPASNRDPADFALTL